MGSQNSRLSSKHQIDQSSKYGPSRNVPINNAIQVNINNDNEFTSTMQGADMRRQQPSTLPSDDQLSLQDQQRLLQALQQSQTHGLRDQSNQGTSRPTSKDLNARKVLGPTSIRTLIKSAATREPSR